MALRKVGEAGKVGGILAAAAIVGIGGAAAIEATDSTSPDRIPSPCVREDDGTFTWRWPPVPECIRPGWIILGPGGKDYRYPTTQPAAPTPAPGLTGSTGG